MWQVKTIVSMCVTLPFWQCFLPSLVSLRRVTARALFPCTAITVTGLFEGYLLYMKGNHLVAIATPCTLKNAEPSLQFASLTTTTETIVYHSSVSPPHPPLTLVTGRLVGDFGLRKHSLCQELLLEQTE